MYNITDQFTTTADFKEGAGNVIPAGSNVYLTADRYWDVLAGTPVTGVKGTKEAYYRRGNVNITPTNIGAVAEDGNISDTTVTFTDATTRANLASNEKVSVSFGKIKKWFADLKSFAFRDLVNNLTTSTTGSALDASQGKILNDKYEELNRSLTQTESEINTKLNAKQNALSSPIKTIHVTGSSSIDLRSYSGHFAYISVAIDNNPFLLLGRTFIIDKNTYETMAGCQGETSTPLCASLKNTGGIYKLVGCYWSATDKTSTTTAAVYVY